MRTRCPRVGPRGPPWSPGVSRVVSVVSLLLALGIPWRSLPPVVSRGLPWSPVSLKPSECVPRARTRSPLHMKEKLVECGVKAHPSDQDLIFDNQSLEDCLKLSDHKIKHLSMLRLTIFLSQSGKPSAHRGDPGGRARSRSPHLLSRPRFVSDSDELARDAVRRQLAERTSV